MFVFFLMKYLSILFNNKERDLGFCLYVCIIEIMEMVNKVMELNGRFFRMFFCLVYRYNV